MNRKSGIQVWIDLLKDLIGFDSGYFYTLKNVYTYPSEVFESYFSNKGKYLSPFTMLGISLTIYYLISGFLVDWDAVAEALKAGYRTFIEWEVDLIAGEADEAKKSAFVDKFYQAAIVPMVDLMILGASTYLVVIVFPIQFVVFYATSLFTKKIGYGFFHHFVAFNYYFSFSLLFLDAVIVISLVNIWVALACLLVFNYFFYGHFFRSYGDARVPVRRAFIKGLAIGFVFLMLCGMIAGMVWGAITPAVTGN